MIGLVLILLAITVYANVTPINCVQSVTPGVGLVTSGGTNPTVSLSPTDTQVETYTSSVTISGNVGITGTINAPLTVTSSETVKANFEVDGYLQLFSRTNAQLAAITPVAVGEMYYCSDCTTLRTCISTGTVVGSFASPVSATTVCN